MMHSQWHLSMLIFKQYVEGVDDALAMALVDADIHTVNSLAELAIVELLEIRDIGNDSASAVIMAAREKEGWFD